MQVRYCSNPFFLFVVFEKLRTIRDSNNFEIKCIAGADFYFEIPWLVSSHKTDTNFFLDHTLYIVSQKMHADDLFAETLIWHP